MTKTNPNQSMMEQKNNEQRILARQMREQKDNIRYHKVIESIDSRITLLEEKVTGSVELLEKLIGAIDGRIVALEDNVSKKKGKKR